MFKNNSLLNRIAIGKTIGFAISLLGVIILNFMTTNEISPMFQLGIILWYTTFGAIIGVFGVFTWHPILRLPMPWWFRSSFLGAWMNFVLALIAYDQLQEVIIAVLGENANISSFWFVLEGLLVGLLIGYFATRFAGEGKEIVEVRQ